MGNCEITPLGIVTALQDGDLTDTEAAEWIEKLYAHRRTTPSPGKAEAERWQPIETAPKDGSMFLCWVSAVRHTRIDGEFGLPGDVSEPDFCQWNGNGGDGYWDNMMGQIGDEYGVTHWMPMPAAPGTATQPDESDRLFVQLCEIRAAAGDNGERMQSELVPFIAGLARDAGRYRFLRNVDSRDSLMHVFVTGAPEELDERIDGAISIEEMEMMTRTEIQSEMKSDPYSLGASIEQDQERDTK
jgi:hypothetical protein